MLIVDDLACRRGGLILLQGICFRVGPGEGLQLMGPNGVGKTTLLMTIAGLTPAAEGRVACNEEELVYVGHQNAVSPLLTVEENLDFWSDLYSVPRDREVMETLAIESIARCQARYCSAGQLRRLALARACISQRRIWLLDEPATSLDSVGVQILKDLLTAHLEQGGIAVVASHERSMVPIGRTVNLRAWRTRTERAGAGVTGRGDNH